MKYILDKLRRFFGMEIIGFAMTILPAPENAELAAAIQSIAGVWRERAVQDLGVAK